MKGGRNRIKGTSARDKLPAKASVGSVGSVGYVSSSSDVLVVDDIEMNSRGKGGDLEEYCPRRNRVEGVRRGNQNQNQRKKMSKGSRSTTQPKIQMFH